MKIVAVTGLLATIVSALPQAPPTATVPIAVEPKAAGPIPSGKLPFFQFPDLAKLASQLGVDPAKATLEPSGLKCQTLQNGKWCYSSAGSFHLGAESDEPISGALSSFMDKFGEWLGSIPQLAGIGS